MQEFLGLENRFKMLTKSKPDQARELFIQAQRDAESRWQFYQSLAARDFKKSNPAHNQQEAVTPPKDTDKT